jgi:signal transduction histidine kinase
LSCDEDLELDSFPGAFSQIITNLVVNSLDHGFENQEDGHINLNFSTSNGYMIFTYSDDGQGMDESIRKKIFDPFFTTKRSSGGSGLGMHIVYNLVTQQLGGSIECQSEQGKGVEYIMSFPNILKTVRNS